jgi:hypothetical protein
MGGENRHLYKYYKNVENNTLNFNGQQYNQSLLCLTL